MNDSIDKPKEKKSGWGGARPGAGRAKGSKNHISVEELLVSLELRTGGQRYEDLLVDDFLTARNENDKNLILKYHTLILNKVMNNLAKIEVNDSADAIQAKQLAFVEALSKLTGVSEQIDSEDSE
jgi:hypothetical protein